MAFDQPSFAAAWKVVAVDVCWLSAAATFSCGIGGEEGFAEVDLEQKAILAIQSDLGDLERFRRFSKGRKRLRRFKRLTGFARLRRYKTFEAIATATQQTNAATTKASG